MRKIHEWKKQWWWSRFTIKESNANSNFDLKKIHLSVFLTFCIICLFCCLCSCVCCVAPIKFPSVNIVQWAMVKKNKSATQSLFINYHMSSLSKHIWRDRERGRKKMLRLSIVLIFLDRSKTNTHFYFMLENEYILWNASLTIWYNRGFHFWFWIRFKRSKIVIIKKQRIQLTIYYDFRRVYRIKINF